MQSCIDNYNSIFKASYCEIYREYRFFCKNLIDRHSNTLAKLAKHDRFLKENFISNIDKFCHAEFIKIKKTIAEIKSQLEDRKHQETINTEFLNNCICTLKKQVMSSQNNIQRFLREQQKFVWTNIKSKYISLKSKQALNQYCTEQRPIQNESTTINSTEYREFITFNEKDTTIKSLITEHLFSPAKNV